MKQIQTEPGCCPRTNAKVYEIILIIGFLLTLILLIINLALTIWFFKFSSSLLAIEILLLVLNASSIILSIILRIWRNNGSVVNENFSSSNAVAIFNLVVVIINFLLSIVEEVLFSLTFAYMIINYFSIYNDLNKFAFNFNDDDFNYYGNDDDDFDYDDDDYEWNNNLNWEDWGDEEDYGTLNGFNDIKKKAKNFYKIMDKLDWGKKDFDFDDDNLEGVVKKLNILKILPWIAFNFNILIQFIMFIFIIILIGRIKRKSDFGFPLNELDHTSHNRMLSKRKSKNLKYIEENIIDSVQKNLGKKKHKKKSSSKSKSMRVNKKY